MVKFWAVSFKSNGITKIFLNVNQCIYRIWNFCLSHRNFKHLLNEKTIKSIVNHIIVQRFMFELVAFESESDYYTWQIPPISQNTLSHVWKCSDILFRVRILRQNFSHFNLIYDLFIKEKKIGELHLRQLKQHAQFNLDSYWDTKMVWESTKLDLGKNTHKINSKHFFFVWMILFLDIVFIWK